MSFRDVAQNSTKLSSTSNGISSNIGRVNQELKETAKSSERIFDESKTLTKISSQLQNIIAKFHLKQVL